MSALLCLGLGYCCSSFAELDVIRRAERRANAVEQNRCSISH
jgi:hypothetical protein